MTLSTKPLGGMRQRYPEEFRVENYVTGKLREGSLKAGFEEYDGPVMEPLSLFAAKSGGELVERQSYTFLDRSEREVILRPEMTPSLARMIAHRGELQLPVRWFSMPLCFRYERPQRGRVREFLQFNCDILGSSDLSADLEIMMVLGGIMESFKAPSSIYRIGWSSRRFMTSALERCGVPSESVQTVFAAVDRRDKMKPGPWRESLMEACGGSEKIASMVEKLVGVESTGDPWLRELMEGCESHEEIVRFQDLLARSGVEGTSFSPAVVRGLDYYTGIVFELMDTGGENRRALCGGGRYDNLVGLFGSKKISGVGFGMGVLTLTLFLETYGLIPKTLESAHPADLYVAVVSGDVLAEAAALARFFRGRGFRTMIDVSGRKIGRQFGEASRLGIPRIVTVGSEEVALGRFPMKLLADGTVTTGTPEELASFLAAD
ncbi:MAG TPA: histidine--tRNA ligase [Candidatus Sabulitectum sp.]|nr:histidine--tRNA ligase [Candidatus Sabulitectum sp.]HPJ28389.1 histidine--tRNA ligase [Candidatus Sabulitectum sp.]HPR22160.1 histidine--tRNA ligase [Candidatus Sabulitectum sp.]